MEMYNKINVVFSLLHNVHSAAYRSKVILIFKVLLFRNILPKARTILDSDSSNGSERSKLKTPLERIHREDTIKNMCDS